MTNKEKIEKFNSVVDLLKGARTALFDIQSGDSYGPFTAGEIQDIVKAARTKIDDGLIQLGMIIL